LFSGAKIGRFSDL